MSQPIVFYRVSDESGKLHVQLVSSGDINKDDLRSEDGMSKNLN